MADERAAGRQRSHRLHVVPWLRRPGGLMLPNWLAITIGRDVFAWRPLSERELRHELVHVAQWRRHGATLALRYLAASALSWRAGTGWYAGNRFEVEARAAEAGPAQRRTKPIRETTSPPSTRETPTR